MKTEEALKRLVDGNARYAAGTPWNVSVSHETRAALFAKGQNPYAAIVGCSDSRVPMELIFDAGPGELFVVRTAGNVVGILEMGSLEFAIESLKTPLIVVLGHQQCGAVEAAVKGGDYSSSLEEVLHEIRCCSPNVADGDLDTVENDNIKHTLAKISANPFISKAVTKGKTQLLSGKYSLETGVVTFF